MGFEQIQFGWLLIGFGLDTSEFKKLFTIHIAYDNKRRRINRIAAKRLRAGKG